MIDVASRRGLSQELTWKEVGVFREPGQDPIHRGLSVSLRRRDRELNNAVGGSLGWACLRIISSWSDSDEKLVPFQMFPGSGGPPSRKELIQQLEVSNLIRLHQYPVGKGATTGAANLICQ
jgi:hypothetical protein